VNPYDPPTPSEPSLEDRIARLEARLGDSKPAGFVLSSFVLLIVMAAGAMLFWIATRAGR